MRSAGSVVTALARLEVPVAVSVAVVTGADQGDPESHHLHFLVAAGSIAVHRRWLEHDLTS
jgi:hypothetical protein